MANMAMRVSWSSSGPMVNHISAGNAMPHMAMVSTRSIRYFFRGMSMVCRACPNFILTPQYTKGSESGPFS